MFVNFFKYIISIYLWISNSFYIKHFMRFYEEKLFKTKKNVKITVKKLHKVKKNNQSNNIMTKASNNVINKTNLEKENKQNKDNKNGKRVVSIALSIITIVAVVTIIMLLIIPQFVEIIKNLIINMPTYLESLKRLGNRLNTTCARN